METRRRGRMTKKTKEREVDGHGKTWEEEGRIDVPRKWKGGKE